MLCFFLFKQKTAYDMRISDWSSDVCSSDLTGSYVLARAGLLDGYRCTIHWENLASFCEDFPEIEVTSELFEIDRNRFTCSGGTATIDMMLNVIARQPGPELAASVADQFMRSEERRVGKECVRTCRPRW